MKMIEISEEKFKTFAKNNPYYNYCQTENYANAMKINGFKHSFVAYTDNNEEILAAGMFLTKKISKNYYYAYSPKGFIIDYNDYDLLRRFTNNLKKYYKRKKVILLKINPEITIANINQNNEFERITNENIDILENLKKLGYKKRKETEPLQLIEPKIKAMVDLKNYNTANLDADTKIIINNLDNKGLELESVNINNFEDFEKLINANNLEFYKKILENFKKDNMADLLLVKVNYEKYLISAKKKAEEEQAKNDELNSKLQKDTSEKNLEEKMKSDKLLEIYNQDVVYATEGLKKNENTYIAGALVIKFNNKIHILIDGKDDNYNYLNGRYYLYNKIFDMYKDEYELADLNEIADDFREDSPYKENNDFREDSPYKENNDFKLEFNPELNEYIGELDLIISNWRFQIAQKDNTLSNEFTKK